MNGGAPAPDPPERIVERLARGGRALVALSGGVDSGVVALLAHRARGEEVVGVTLTGSAVSLDEVAAAEAAARRIGLVHRWVEADPLSSPEYASNPTDRCYFCRKVEGAALRRFGAEVGARQFLDGLHLDDLGDDRPGRRALDEAGFHHPLLEAGWDKSRVRSFARDEGLPNWDRPSNACLASRIAHGQPITPALLARVDRAESQLRALGFRQVRVRIRGAEARVEVGAEEVHRLNDPSVSERVRRELASVGLPAVVLDPRGYRPGGGD
jgi:uncharacterized protein